jgi:hypothetical protein
MDRYTESIKNPCVNCPASRNVKNTLGCNADRLNNAFEDLKHDICKKYSCKYQCRFFDVVMYEYVLMEKEGKSNGT